MLQMWSERNCLQLGTSCTSLFLRSQMTSFMILSDDLALGICSKTPRKDVALLCHGQKAPSLAITSKERNARKLRVGVLKQVLIILLVFHRRPCPYAASDESSSLSLSSISLDGRTSKPTASGCRLCLGIPNVHGCGTPSFLHRHHLQVRKRVFGANVAW